MAELTTAEKILQNALAPKRVRGDSGEVEQHPIADQLAAAALAGDTTKPAARAGLGIRFVKLVPPGMQD